MIMCANEHDEVFVGDAGGALLDLGNFVQEIEGLGIGEEVLGLPVLAGVLEKVHELRRGKREKEGKKQK